MSDFLKNLQNAVERGEFNSDAAKKINEIDELANNKLDPNDRQGVEKLDEKLSKQYAEKVEPVSEEDALEMNSQYEKKMEELRMSDAVNNQMALLIDIDDSVEQSIADMFEFIAGLESNFVPDIEKRNKAILTDLTKKIDEVKTKYGKFIN